MNPSSKLARLWQRVTSRSSPPETIATPIVPTAEEIYDASEGSELRQSEIITGLIQLVTDLDSIKSGSKLIVNSIEHPYVIVVSEDCDLTQDFDARRKNQLTSDKIMPSVLFCQVTTAKELRGPAGEGMNKDLWSKVKINKDERYQFLEKVPPASDALGEGLPELGIDFKRHFSLPTEEAYYRIATDAKRRCRLRSPYLEHFSTRFAYFLSRVALPADHRSD